MNKYGISAALGAVLIASTTLVHTASAEVTLSSVTSLDQNNLLVVSFRTNYVTPVNAKLKGSLKIKYLGGQEIVPPRKAVTALRRRQFDILHSPTAYYIGTVPEGYAILAANQGPAALRANGAWAILQEAYLKKAGAHLLAWGENMTSFNTYLQVMPKFGKDGVPDLTGIKMRATGTYRPLFRALGASTINIKSSEIYTAVQRGTVDGFGYVDVSLVPLGLHKVVKYRVTPNYYQTNTVVTANPDSWKALSRDQRATLEALALEYETSSVHWMEAKRKDEEQQIKAAGVKDIALTGAAAAKYLDIAHREIWKQLKERSEYHDRLKPLMYIPGKPNRQADLGRALRQ